MSKLAPVLGRSPMKPAVSPEMLARWQQRLRLVDWHVAVSGAEPDTDSRSQVDIDVLVRQAAIRLRKDTPASQVERQLVHELLHVVMSGMEDAFHAAKVHTPKAWDDAGDRMWGRGEESAIESLTDALTGTTRANWEPDAGVWSEAFPPETPA